MPIFNALMSGDSTVEEMAHKLSGASASPNFMQKWPLEHRPEQTIQNAKNI